MQANKELLLHSASYSKVHVYLAGTESGLVY